jgi:hypothetical protein
MDGAPDDDDPLTLKEACQLVFRGTLTASTLRAEADRGKLKVFKIGRRLFTTRAYVREMIEQCRVAPRTHGSLSARPSGGLSEDQNIARAKAGLEAAIADLKATGRARKR